MAELLLCCRHCAAEGYTARWQEDRNGRRRIRADCLGCGRFLAWLPILEPWITSANRNASPTPILDVLTRLDDLDAELRSDGRTVWVKARDWRRVPPDLHALIRQCSHRLARLMGRRTA